jgi:hypothetical protein
MCIHLLCCAHGIERTKTHDAIHNTFATIVWDASFHMGQKQLHALPSTTFNSFCWRVDIMFTNDGIHTLVDVVITEPTQANLFPWSCTTQGFGTSDVAQAKEMSYCN